MVENHVFRRILDWNKKIFLLDRNKSFQEQKTKQAGAELGQAQVKLEEVYEVLAEA